MRLSQIVVGIQSQNINIQKPQKAAKIMQKEVVFFLFVPVK